MTLADTQPAMLAYLNVPAGGTTTTIEAKTNFLAAVERRRDRERQLVHKEADDRAPG